MQAKNVFTTGDAERWGGNFIIPSNIVESDEALFRASMRDIDAMDNRRKDRIHGSRLNPERVAKYVSHKNPEMEKMTLLATSGMPLLLEPGKQKSYYPTTAKNILGNEVGCQSIAV